MEPLIEEASCADVAGHSAALLVILVGLAGFRTEARGVAQELRQDAIVAAAIHAGDRSRR